MFGKLKPLFTVRFIKFCQVGASGVLVNLGALAVFSEVLRLHLNLASALAIEVSIISNFLINEVWTFGDQRNLGQGGRARRAFRFHLVSIVGAAAQWTVFVALNTVWLALLFEDSGQVREALPGGSWVEQYLILPVTEPPDVGNLKYISQLCGIGMATLWNYFANFYWTWGVKPSSTGK